MFTWSLSSNPEEYDPIIINIRINEIVCGCLLFYEGKTVEKSFLHFMTLNECYIFGIASTLVALVDILKFILLIITESKSKQTLLIVVEHAQAQEHMI